MFARHRPPLCRRRTGPTGLADTGAAVLVDSPLVWVRSMVTQTPTPPSGPSREWFRDRSVQAWASYDFAIAPFAILVATVTYSTYFKEVVVSGARNGDFMWGLAGSLSIGAVALTAPVLGVVADVYAAKRTPPARLHGTDRPGHAPPGNGDPGHGLGGHGLLHGGQRRLPGRAGLLQRLPARTGLAARPGSGLGAGLRRRLRRRTGLARRRPAVLHPRDQRRPRVPTAWSRCATCSSSSPWPPRS